MLCITLRKQNQKTKKKIDEKKKKKKKKKEIQHQKIINEKNYNHLENFC